MRSFAMTLAAVGCAMMLVGVSDLARAQATRTWVSGIGDDANPCSRTAPCKTFAGAISKTAAGGEIDCLDPGGFGAVTVTKSITIDCAGVTGGVLSAATNGVVINGAGAVVVLRNLVIQGAGSGLVGINFLQGSALHLENCRIMGFTAGTAIGLRFNPTIAAELTVIDTVLSENGTAALVQPNAGGSVKAVFNRSSAINNAAGIRIEGTGSTGTINVAIHNSMATGNTNNGIIAVGPTGGAILKVMIDESVSSNNGTGVTANGPNATIFLSASALTGNATGLNVVNSGTLSSFGNNRVAGNTVDGNPTGTPIGLR